MIIITMILIINLAIIAIKVTMPTIILIQTMLRGEVSIKADNHRSMLLMFGVNCMVCPGLTVFINTR